MLSFFRHSLTKRCYSTATNLPYTKIHVPVLLPEVLTHLAPKDGGVYCDMTFGDGGYTKAILGKREHISFCRLVLISINR
jgi:16S rRNA (cytosine1402-N4)-methyltransferase